MKHAVFVFFVTCASPWEGVAARSTGFPFLSLVFDKALFMAAAGGSRGQNYHFFKLALDSRCGVKPLNWISGKTCWSFSLGISDSASKTRNQPQSPQRSQISTEQSPLTLCSLWLFQKHASIFMRHRVRHEAHDGLFRKQWLKKLNDTGARERAERVLKQLESIQGLLAEAQRDPVQESGKHQGYKTLRQIPGLGPIRVALIIAFVMTPHRFQNKRQFWTYTGFSVIHRGSAEYQITQGELKRTKRKPLPRGLNNNYNRVLKNVFKGAALTAAYRGPFKKIYDQRVANGTAPNLALLTLARKIASITLWKKGKRFDIERHLLSEQTT